MNTSNTQRLKQTFTIEEVKEIMKELSMIVIDKYKDGDWYVTGRNIEQYAIDDIEVFMDYRKDLF